ncbi:cytochrome oxidase putative small subunit CydP [Pseudomonas sp. BMS12]|uniref:cytochrome oxidase putative small subunit CydP n=1 Tax=Pseudomonas sp. BMS12 TaxID=1796033 RepID=UPI001F26D5EB
MREITAILLIKLALLLAIKAIWFDAPTIPENGAARVDAHLFNESPRTEEKPR